nr:uncharacterized protein LOC126528195 [Dermacentor andersoni]
MCDADVPECVEDTELSTLETKVLRCNLNNAAEAEQWMRNYSAETNTSWIVDCVATKCTRMVFRKVWRCQHHKRNKITARRNTDCPAKLDIKIKKVNPDTQRNYKYLCRSTPLPAVIKLAATHNNSTECADSLKLLRASPETRAAFDAYFEAGFTPAAAIRHHEEALAMQDNSHILLANDCEIHLMTVCSHYAGTCIYTAGTPDCWAVLVVTPIMQRAQSLDAAQEIIFVDSTSSCDVTRSTATIMLTTTKAGAVPIAVLLHSSQTTEGYSLAFQLLKDSCPSCFGNRQAPLVLMSDNSRPEKDALKKAWPAAEQLLCQFHVLQAEWRWLTAASNKVPKEDRRQLMAAFQKEAKEHLRTVGHEGYVHRVEAFLCCEKEWVQMYRTNLATRGHNTNNYSEASIRILKDVVLCRTKAYNAVALVEIIVSTWEKYFETRLLRHAHHREASHRLTFEHLLQDLPELPAGSVTISGETYYVPSSSSNATYQVQADVGICTCWVGSQGAFCKHQAAVQRAFGGCFPNSPKLTPADCKQLGQLALGERCPPLDFFLPMRPTQQGDAPSEPIEDEALNMAESASGAPSQQQPWQRIAPNSCPQPGPSTTPDFCPQPGPSTAPDFCPQPGPSTAPDFCAQPEVF